RCRIIPATVVLPQATPPVSPTRSNLASLGQGRAEEAGATAQLGRLQGVGHQHGDGQRPYAAWHRRERSGNLGHLGMHVADQGVAVLSEGQLALLVALKIFV